MATDAARAFPRALATRTSGRTQISRQALELAMVTSRSREASEVVPSPEVGAVGSVGPAEEDQPPARSAHPRDSVWSATSTDTARNRRDGFASDETQHRPIRARFPSINVRPFPIKRAFLGAPRLSRALGGPSVGHRVFRRRAIDPRVRNPSRALRAIIHTPIRRPHLVNPYPRSARGPLASTSRRLDCRRPPPGGVEAPPRESTRARATPNTPPARPAARSS